MRDDSYEQVEAGLHLIENAIIEKMAHETGYQPFQMRSMIERNPELKTFYQNMRKTVLEEMAKH